MSRAAVLSGLRCWAPPVGGVPVPTGRLERQPLYRLLGVAATGARSADLTRQPTWPGCPIFGVPAGCTQQAQCEPFGPDHRRQRLADGRARESAT